MAKRKKLVLIVLGFSFLSLTVLLTVNAFSANQTIVKALNSSDYDSGYYTSSRYTKVDDLTVNPKKGVKLIETMDEKGNLDQLIHENDRFLMYFNDRLNIVKLKNKESGYVWSSGLDEIDKNDVSSPYHASFLSSTVGIGYFFYNTTNESYGDTQYCFINQARINNDSDLYIIEPNTYDAEVNSKITSTGVKLDINVKRYQITLKVYIDLHDNGLVVRVPDSEITENIHLLSTLHLLPAFGATKGTEEPGYMVIPDGSGALIRYGEVSQTSQIALRYFGADLGTGSAIKNISLNPEKTLSAPIYGLINGVNQHGLLTILEKGSEQAELFVSLKGTLNINYNFLTPRFIMRNKFLLYGVNSTVEKYRSCGDISANYWLLEENDSDYVGVARVYQNYLVANNQLKKTSNGNYSVMLDVIMSETVPALIGTKNITLTSLDALKTILNELKENEIDNILMVLKGWNKKGLSGATPYQIKFNKKVGSKSEFKGFLTDYGSHVYLYNDYQVAYDKGIASSRTDVARTIQRLKMNYVDDEAELYQNYSLLYPTASKEIAKSNLKKYQKLKINNLAIDGIGTRLYSTYLNGEINSRLDSANAYIEMMNALSKDLRIGLYVPNSYLWPYLSSYFGMSLYSNHYSLYTDTVPLIPYILKGYVDYYATSINFYANLEDQTLRLLDYGAYPSFTITNSPARDLKYTNSNSLFSTRYSDWKGTIIELYSTYLLVYQLIGDSSIVRRNVVSPGIVEIEYTNQLKLRINYTENTYLTTPPNAFEVLAKEVKE
jgi:hypothetical protein